MKPLLIPAALLCLLQAAPAATYYVDSSWRGNDDTHDGLTVDTPWQTTQRVNQVNLQPGDTVLFRKGRVFRGAMFATTPRSGQLRIKDDGTSSNPIVFDSYAYPGDPDVKPIVSGSSEILGQLPVDGHPGLYRKNWTDRYEPQQVFFTVSDSTDLRLQDGRRGVRKASMAELTNDFDWCVENNYLYYRYAAGGTHPTVEATEYKLHDSAERVSNNKEPVDPPGSNIYKSELGYKPGFVYFNAKRGRQVAKGDAGEEQENLTLAGDWYYDADSAPAYLFYKISDPSVSVDAPDGRQATAHLVAVSGSHVTIRNLQLERVERSAVLIDEYRVEADESRTPVTNVTLDNLAIRQWSNDTSGTIGGVNNSGDRTRIIGCVFGKSTEPATPPANIEDLTQREKDDEGENWAGFIPIYTKGSNYVISGNRIYHTCVERGYAGRLAFGIQVQGAAKPKTQSLDVNLRDIGVNEISYNHIYDVGSNGIMIKGYFGASTSGQVLAIHHNTITLPGQAGINAFQCRVPVGSWGNLNGSVYANTVTYADRLGGPMRDEVHLGTGHGISAAGIHFNNGRHQNEDETVVNPVDDNYPFMKWKCFENDVSRSHSFDLYAPRETFGSLCPDSDGIAIDYNADHVEVYRNRIYNCDGRGMYIWNANHATIAYNVIYGNDAGITIGRDNKAETPESAEGNVLVNNTFYRNWNTDAVGNPDTFAGLLDAEIMFSIGVEDSVIKNNILYPYPGKYVYRKIYPNSLEADGNVIDYNLVYRDTSDDVQIVREQSTIRYWNTGTQSWRSVHPTFDAHTVYGVAPGFIGPFPNPSDPWPRDIADEAFAIEGSAAVVNAGTPVTFPSADVRDFEGGRVVGAPDIGAYERRGVARNEATTTHEGYLHYSSEYYRIGQGFRIPQTGQPFKVELFGHRRGSWSAPESAQMAVQTLIYTNGIGDVPSFSAPWISDPVLVQRISPGANEWITFNVEPQTAQLNLSADTTYHIVLRGSSIQGYIACPVGFDSTSDNVVWRRSIDNPYLPSVSGCGMSDISDTGTRTQRSHSDLNFRLYYNY